LCGSFGAVPAPKGLVPSAPIGAVIASKQVQRKTPLSGGAQCKKFQRCVHS
jgi:hypothetical protein